MQSSRKPFKTRGKSWKFRCQHQCLARSGEAKRKYACVVEAHESTRKRSGGTLHKGHEDHIAGKGNNSLMNHYNRVYKFVPVPQAMKMLDAKAAVEKTREKLEEILARQLTKVRNKKRGDR